MDQPDDAETGGEGDGAGLAEGGPRRRGRQPAGEGAILIGARLKEARRKRSLKQAVLATWLGVSRQQIGKYEKGKNRVSSSALAIAAERLEVDVSWLIGAVGSPEPTAPLTPEVAAVAGRIARLDAERRDRVVAIVGLVLDALEGVRGPGT